MAEIHRFPGSGDGPPATIDGPHNLDVERGLIGAILSNAATATAVLGRVEPQHFAEPLHRQIFGVLVEMLEAKRPITASALKTYLPQGDVSPGKSMFGYIGDCIVDAALPLHVAGYADEIVDLHTRRELLRVGRALVEAASDSGVGPRSANMLDAVEADILAVRSCVVSSAVTTSWAGEAADQLIGDLKDIVSGVAKPKGCLTGLSKLDRVTGGVHPGDLWVVGGRPGMGKSTLGTTIARGLAQHGIERRLSDAGARVDGSLFFSLELSRDQVMARILADLAYKRRTPFTDVISFGDILKGRLRGDQVYLVDEARKKLGSLPLMVDWSSRLTTSQIASRVRSRRADMAKHGCDLRVVVLDYLKMIQSSDRYRGQRAQEVAEISGALKQLAKDEGIAVVLLAQLNRQNELRGDPRPQLSDLKESGDLEADADVVAFCYRPEYYIKQSKGYIEKQQDALDRYDAVRGKFELIIAKNRAGMTPTLDLFCDMGGSMITDRDLSLMGGHGNLVPDDAPDIFD